MREKTSIPEGSLRLAEVGRILKPRGVKGEVFVVPEREGLFPFEEGRTVWLGRGHDPLPLRVEHFFIHKGLGVLKLEGISTPEGASEWAGLALLLPEDEVGEDPPEVFDPAQVKGFSVVDRTRGPVGAVIGARPGPSYWYFDAEGPKGPFEFPVVAGLGVEVLREASEVLCDLPAPWPGLDEREGDPRGASGGEKGDAGAD
jgi:16S rRNA processing protein RimM